jgi:hypothetical protein
MKRIAVVALLSLALATSVFAQAQDTVTVTAAVQAVVVFTVDTPLGGSTFDFGNVDAVGTGTYNVGLVVAPGVSSTTYTATGAFEWELRSAPRANADVTSTASKTVGTTVAPDGLGRASMALGQLQMDWNQTNGNGTVTSLLTPIAATNTWIDNAVVGNGNGGPAPRNEGTIDLRLTVDDDDLAEANEWTIVFTATLS